MRVIEAPNGIQGLKVIEPDVHHDERGFFVETYSEQRYAEIGIRDRFVQDNESLSSIGVARGLHWQAAPHTQAKLVHVVRGSAWDVAVDIRKGSPTFGKHVSVFLTGANHKQFYIPRGFAHGFISLENDTLFSYKCDRAYCKESERGIRFDDQELGIELPSVNALLYLSEKDRSHPTLAAIEPWEDSKL